MPRSRFSFPSIQEDGPRWVWCGIDWAESQRLMDEQARQSQEEVRRTHEEATARLFEQYMRWRIPTEPDPPTYLRKRVLRGNNEGR